jgi:flagellar biosynthesis protein FlhG
MTAPLPAASTRSLARADNMVAVASGKGGVGKTWLAATLAHALARQGGRTLLFDGDLGLANVDIQLGLTPERDLGAAVAGRLALAEAITRYRDGGFDVLAGKSGSGALGMLQGARLEALRDDLLDVARGYDRVVLDLGAGVDGPVRAFAAASGVVLVVATDEPTSLTDAYALIKVIAARYPGSDIRIVVNMAGGKQEAQRTYNTLAGACRNFLKFSPPLAAVIRRDPNVKDSIRHQAPMLTRHPNSAAAVDVEALARSIAERR